MGSVTASANWEYIYSQKLFVNLTGVYAHNSSKFYHRNQLYFTGSGAAQQRAEEVKIISLPLMTWDTDWNLTTVRIPGTACDSAPIT